MTDLNEKELKPCPFCGKAAQIAPDEIGSGGQHVPPYHAGCFRGAGCGIAFTADDPDEAIEEWNRRSLTSATPPDVASLWAPAKQEEIKIGWTYDFNQIERITRAAEKDTGFEATMEIVQFVMREADRRAATALRLSAGGGGSQAARDVLDERRRQVEVEGWTSEHDDRHDNGELSRAAAAYAHHSTRPKDKRQSMAEVGAWPSYWPWDVKWWKPTDPRRDLVKAGALILAEIERLDRLPASPTVEAGHVE